MSFMWNRYLEFAYRRKPGSDERALGTEAGRLGLTAEIERRRIAMAAHEAKADIKAEETFNAFLAQLRELEDLLRRWEVPHVDGWTERGKVPVVRFSDIVELEDEDSGEVLTWHIVGEFEADPSRGRVSYKSPLGLAVVGRRIGETVLVRAPKGPEKWFTITRITLAP